MEQERRAFGPASAVICPTVLMPSAVGIGSLITSRFSSALAGTWRNDSYVRVRCRRRGGRLLGTMTTIPERTAPQFTRIIFPAVTLIVVLVGAALPLPPWLGGTLSVPTITAALRVTRPLTETAADAVVLAVPRLRRGTHAPDATLKVSIAERTHARAALR